MSKVKVRIAPSPTGDPHVGTAYIALFNYAYAKKYGGKFILRIEDTDRTRYSDTSEQQIFDSLHWLDLNYDEGPDVGGDCGPYRQSERFHLYKKYALELVKKGMAYYAFETPEEIEQMRARQKAMGQAPMYDRRARKLTQEEIDKNLAENKPYVIRMKMPYEGQTVVHDELRGDIYFDNDKIDDQVLLKSDGFPTYHLANIVDDHLMGVTAVIRAEEWITSTPKHVQLYKAFGWEMPKFYHMPLLRNADKTKISKRKNHVSLNYYRQEGYLKEALINFLGLMGWSMPPKEDGISPEIFSLDDMIENFDFSRISLGGPVFDVQKLNWLNNHYMVKKDLSELTEMCIPYFKEKGYDISIFTKEKLEKIVEIIRLSANTLNDISIKSEDFFNDKIILQEITEEMNKKDRKSIQKMNEALTHDKANVVIEMFIDKLQKLDDAFTIDDVSQLLHNIMDELQESPSVVLMNIRARLTGKPRGIDLNSLVYILGKERVIARIENR